MCDEAPCAAGDAADTPSAVLPPSFATCHDVIAVIMDFAVARLSDVVPLSLVCSAWTAALRDPLLWGARFEWQNWSGLVRRSSDAPHSLYSDFAAAVKAARAFRPIPAGRLHPIEDCDRGCRGCVCFAEALHCSFTPKSSRCLDCPRCNRKVVIQVAGKRTVVAENAPLVKMSRGEARACRPKLPSPQHRYVIGVMDTDGVSAEAFLRQVVAMAEVGMGRVAIPMHPAIRFMYGSCAHVYEVWPLTAGARPKREDGCDVTVSTMFEILSDGHKRQHDFSRGRYETIKNISPESVTLFLKALDSWYGSESDTGSESSCLSCENNDDD